ncbi:MAG: hypothetical protein R6U41_12515 [Desulfosalsimonas sp.]|uniref:hypothetical protein n=1 Tax=Desulfosalsimonas sp. TaxID=3073848 RepID=UPI003970503E
MYPDFFPPPEIALYYQDLACAALPNAGQQTRLAAASQVPPSFCLNGKSIAIAVGSRRIDRLDILVVDQIGKEISGIGMDSNITGRHRDIAGDFSAPPCPGRIFVCDLTQDSDGNANGIGLADVTTARLVKRMDREKTAVNAVTAISPEKPPFPYILIRIGNASRCACIPQASKMDQMPGLCEYGTRPPCNTWKYLGPCSRTRKRRAG